MFWFRTRMNNSQKPQNPSSKGPNFCSFLARKMPMWKSIAFSSFAASAVSASSSMQLLGTNAEILLESGEASELKVNATWLRSLENDIKALKGTAVSHCVFFCSKCLPFTNSPPLLFIQRPPLPDFNPALGLLTNAPLLKRAKSTLTQTLKSGRDVTELSGFLHTPFCTLTHCTLTRPRTGLHWLSQQRPSRAEARFPS